jgi:hypothetical protein
MCQAAGTFMPVSMTLPSAVSLISEGRDPVQGLKEKEMKERVRI